MMKCFIGVQSARQVPGCQ